MVPLDTQEMKMEHPEEDMIFDADEDKDDDVIDEEEVYCTGVLQLIRYIITVERI